MASHFEDLISQGRGRPFEIEHIWADKYERFTDWFPHPSDFETERNRIGGLVLLQRGINQSLNDAPYEDKRDAYATHGANVLARSLHPMAYQNNPAFTALIDRTGLQFRPYDAFGPEQQQERQELYIRIAEWVWNPSRLDLDGEKPPVHEFICERVDAESGSRIDPEPRRMDLSAFWIQLLDYAKEKSDLHARVSPRKDNWLSSHRHGVAWCYSVQEHQIGPGLYLDSPDTAANKALFDALHVQREAVEVEFGSPLNWYRLDDKKGCWIGINFPGGWRDEATWSLAIEQAVDAMQGLYTVLAPRILALRSKT